LNLYRVYNITISDNKIYENTENGIELVGSWINVLSDNSIYTNGLSGILLRDSAPYWSDSNNITGNTVYNNTENGINLNSSWYNDVWDNDLYENSMNGLSLVNARYGEIYGNVLRDNLKKGVYVDISSTGNLFYENAFHRNEKNALDESSNGNDWNSTTIGNYWDDYTGPDADSNQIGDIPYNVSLSPLIQDFLPIVDHTSPTVSITSPNLGEVFGPIAPSFSISVTDSRLYYMWYTIDGGINNYTFTENGLIDQSAWDALTDGSVTFRVYVNDKPGNIGTDEVNIIKDTQAPIIIINSPTEGQKVGKKAPLFNLTIIDHSLNMIWYSFDGGITNYTIANNTKLDQTPWAALPVKANVTITFYANDVLGNEASSSVKVFKAAPSRVGTVVIIIIASSAGGGAIAVGAYILLKRRRGIVSKTP
jgi:parallel beta-helix repeat protein